MTEFTKTFRRTTYPAISPTSPMNDQSDRTILITGGSSGIGYGTAKAFASANAARVILIARNRERLEAAAAKIMEEYPSARVSIHAADCASQEQMSAMWKQFAEDDVFVDVFVIGASATQPPKTLEEQVAAINFNMIVNLSSFECFRKQPNPSKRSTCLISLSSAALHCYPYQAGTYAATKAGFADYLCHMADFISENEMRIINYHPGAVYTEAAEKAGEVPKDLPIWDDPSLSSDMAVWLAGENAGFLHGRYIWANWDAEELMGMKEQLLADPGYLKIGITGLDSFSVKGLMEICTKFPAPKR